jgi:hypothetical protein
MNLKYAHVLALLILAGTLHAAPALIFSYPTPANNTVSMNTSYSFNVSVSDASGLNSFVWNWNGTNYSVYDASLVAMLNFNNLSALGDSATRATDASIYGNNANITGCPYTPGVYGAGVRFNLSDYANIPNSETLENITEGSYTWGAWYYPASIPPFDVNAYNSVNAIICKPGYHTQISYSNASTFAGFGFTMYNSTSGGFGGTYTSSPPNQWYHVMLTINRTSSTNATYAFYLNGNLISSGPYTGAPYEYGTSKVKIGGCSTPGANYGWTANGTIDEVRIYNRSLSNAEVALLYNSSLSKYNSTSWGFQSVQGTVPGTYSYSAYANASNGGASTETRYLTEVPPYIGFVSSTPANNTVSPNASYTINVSLSNASGLNSFAWNWNGTNYSLYDPGLLLMLNLDNNSALGENASNAADSSQYGINGAIVNATWASGAYGSALAFDGASASAAYVNFTSVLINNASSNLSVEAWIYPTSLVTNDTYIVSKGASCVSLTRGWEFVTFQGRIGFRYSNNGSVYMGKNSNSSLSVNTWNHAVVVFSNGNITFYINGRPSGFDSSGSGNTINPNSLNLKIGNGYCGSSDPNIRGFYGSIDEVRVWNRSFSAAEIAQHYKSSLNMYDATTWKFISSQATAPGTYSYSAYANASNGNASTETRYLTEVPPYISFVSPTPANNTASPNATYTINISIMNASQLNSFVWNWNGTNYSLYDSSLAGMWDFNEMPMDDNFSGTSLNSAIWNDQSFGYASVNNSLTISAPEGAESWPSLFQNRRIYGDFDMQVDFSSFSGADNVYNSLGVCQSTGEGALVIDWNNCLQVYHTPSSFICRALDNGTYHDTYMNIAAASARVRLVRTGSTAACYYWNSTISAWQLMANITTIPNITTGDAYLQAYRYASHPINVTFGNFTVNSGEYASDASQYSMNAALYNATFASGRYGNGISVSGTGYTISANSSMWSNFTALTTSFWLYPARCGGLDGSHSTSLLTDADMAGNMLTSSWLYEFWPSCNLNLIVWNGSTYGSSASSTLSGANQWYHITGVYNGTHILIYINGALNSTGAAPANGARIETGPRKIYAAGGPCPSGWGCYNGSFSGIQDDVRIWNRSLSAAEIAQHYKSSLNRYDATTWSFMSTQGNLTPGAYSYSAYANASNGQANTETRYLNEVPGCIGASRSFICGDLVNESCTLNGNMSASGTSCLNVTAANVAIDCAGYTMNGNNTFNTSGIYTAQFNTSVRNCRISGFNIGLYYYLSSNGSIQNSNVSNAVAYSVDPSYGNAIAFVGSSNNYVNNVTVFSQYNTAMIVHSNSMGNRITNSSFYSSAGSYAFGFLMNSDNNVLANSNITGSGVFGTVLYYVGIQNDTLENCTVNGLGGPFTLQSLGVNSENRIVNNSFLNATNHIYVDPSGSINTFCLNNLSSVLGTYINDTNGSNSYNCTYSGLNQGNIYPNVLNGSVEINGNVSSSIGGLYIGRAGAGFPYNSSNSQGKIIGTATDYAPLTPTYGIRFPNGVSSCVGASRSFICGDLVNESCTLNGNMSASGTNCFSAAAANVAIDCAGFAVTGNNTLNTYGIISNQFNTSVRNCNISGFDTGIFFNGADNGSIINTSAICAVDFSLGTAHSIAFYLNNSKYNLLQDDVAVSTYSRGLFYSKSDYNTISNLSATGVQAILAEYSSGTVIANSSGKGVNVGMLFRNSAGNSISNSYFSAHSTNAALSMVNMTLSSFLNNTFNGSGVYAIFLFSIGIRNNTFIGNTLISDTSIANLNENSSGNTFCLNNFSATAGYYIYDNNGSNSYNCTYAGLNQGNIYADVLNGSTAVRGYVNSSVSGLYIGVVGAGYPYNSTTAPGKMVGNVADYAPLTPTFGYPLSSAIQFPQNGSSIYYGNGTLNVTVNYTGSGTDCNATISSGALSAIGGSTNALGNISNGNATTFSLNLSSDAANIYDANYTLIVNTTCIGSSAGSLAQINVYHTWSLTNNFVGQTAFNSYDVGDYVRYTLDVARDGLPFNVTGGGSLVYNFTTSAGSVLSLQNTSAMRIVSEGKYYGKIYYTQAMENNACAQTNCPIRSDAYLYAPNGTMLASQLHGDQYSFNATQQSVSSSLYSFSLFNASDNTVMNLSVYNSNGAINWSGSELNLSDANPLNLDSAVVLGNGFVYVNSTAYPGLNSTPYLYEPFSAAVAINGVDCSKGRLYYGANPAKQAIIAANYPCGSLCANQTCANGTVRFTASGFSGYAYGVNSNLIVYDATDSQGIEANQTVRFFANFSNASGAAIPGAACNFTENSGGSYSAPAAMSFNASSALYEHSKSFAGNGTFMFNVSCTSSAGFDNLSANDSFAISPLAFPGIAVDAPAAATYTFTNISLNYTASNASACWYYLNGNGPFVLAGCANTTITGAEGANNITVYANSPTGNNNSSTVLFSVDTIAPAVSVQSPANATYNIMGIDLNYIAGDASSCWYYLNSAGPVALSGCANATITASEGANSIEVYANDSAGNTNSSIVYFAVNITLPNPPDIAIFNLSACTNFSAVADLSNVTNLTLANPSGRLQFPASHAVNAGNENYSRNVALGAGMLAVNSSALSPSFNSSATITFYNVTCPAEVYYAPGFVASRSEILAFHLRCSASTSPACTNIVCSGSTLTFTVPHFSSYAYGLATNLNIWDGTDSAPANLSENIGFYANFTDAGNLTISDGNCQIRFYNGSWTPYVSMAYNSSAAIYDYTRNFTSASFSRFGVVCNTSDNVYSISAEDPIAMAGAMGNGTLNVTYLDRYGTNSSGNSTTEGGNISVQNMTASTLTDRWAGMYGNVSGNIYLTDSDSSTPSPLYSWSVSDPNRLVVCASTNSAYPFSSAGAGTGSDIDTAWSFGAVSDNGSITFNTSTCTLTLIEATISNTGKAVHQGASSFSTCIAKSGSGKGSLAFCTAINQTGKTYSNQTSKYELIVPTSFGTGIVETYYLYAELG